ncbi:MAG: hypothetical protein AB7V58_17185 [Solirubrobacterales bacterium]
MSAFVVDAPHIDAVLSAAINGPTDPRQGRHDWHPPYVHELLGALEPLGSENASAAGRELLEQCIASVAHRFPDCGDQLPGPIPTPRPEQYEWTDLGKLMTAVEACKAIACLEYQSCEHPGWATSGSRAFCSELRAALVTRFDGYGSAPWQWDVDLALDRRARSWR